MRSIRIACTFLAFAVSGCAHFPSDLGSWGAKKAERLAECVAKDLTSREGLLRCMGDLAIDLGTQSCHALHEEMVKLPHN